jgi:ribA/ribD-fused uncharacterized protein
MTQAITSFTGEYRFLSNFYYSPIEYEGIRYPTVEHAYQAAKSLDKEERQRIALLTSPGKAKQYGRTMKTRGDWRKVNFSVMEDLLRLKFSDQKFRGLLSRTGDSELVEGNTWGDTFWGQCNGVGLNVLGRFLMKVRSSL